MNENEIIICEMHNILAESNNDENLRLNIILCVVADLYSPERAKVDINNVNRSFFGNKRYDEIDKDMSLMVEEKYEVNGCGDVSLDIEVKLVNMGEYTIYDPKAWKVLSEQIQLIILDKNRELNPLSRFAKIKSIKISFIPAI